MEGPISFARASPISKSKKFVSVLHHFPKVLQLHVAVVVERIDKDPHGGIRSELRSVFFEEQESSVGVLFLGYLCDRAVCKDVFAPTAW